MVVAYDVEFNSAAHYPADGVIELAVMAEAVGFEAYWKGESNSTDPLVLLSGVATRTSTLKLGTAIYHFFGRSPVQMGIQAATLQDMSHGRLLLGLGAANKSIAGWHGVEFDRPLRRAREYVEIVRAVARGERVDYQGEIYTTGKGFKLSWAPGYPQFPIYLAGLGEQMTRLAGRLADGVVINMATPPKIREIAERVRASAVAAGRDPSQIDIIAKARVTLHPDRATARNRLRQVLTFYNLADYYGEMLIGLGFGEHVTAVREGYRQAGFKAAMAAVRDEYMDQVPMVAATSIEEVKERLAPYFAAGVTRFVIPYVPATDNVVDDAKTFLRAWGGERAGRTISAPSAAR
jgi:alkanesulfonate monooxygenase SsuD/methylene tetrahydromethanopterin reductase-like flavin-dependent oxidoreductase (luciferase family)